MTSFESDYNNGAHPEVLRSLVENNGQQSASYGYDVWSEQARQKIRNACQCPDADIYFLVGGTQANATVIDGVLTGYEGVIAVDTAHINVHESGAVEANGHKIIILPSHNGKMSAADLKDFHDRFYADPVYEHMVIPGIVYITFPTELGTVYTKQEISDLYALCQEFATQIANVFFQVLAFHLLYIYIWLFRQTKILLFPDLTNENGKTFFFFLFSCL